MLGSELWESTFDGLLDLVREYIVDVWKIRKHKLYDSALTPDLVNYSILSLHLGIGLWLKCREMVSSI